MQHRPDVTVEELQALSNADGSIMAAKRALDRLGYRYIKTRHAAEQEREDIRLRREQWPEKSPGRDPSNQMFIEKFTIQMP